MSWTASSRESPLSARCSRCRFSSSVVRNFGSARGTAGRFTLVIGFTAMKSRSTAAESEDRRIE